MFSHTRYRIRSPDNSRAGAAAYEVVIRQQLARGESIGRTLANMSGDNRFDRFATLWFRDYVVPNNKPSEQRTKKYILERSLVPFFKSTSLDKITAHDIERYKAQMSRDGVKNKTIKNRLTVLNKLLKTAYEWLQLNGQPPKITWPKCASFRTDYLSAEECERVIANAEGVVQEMILAALRTGMRQGELKGLQWSSIDWANRQLTVQHSLCDRAKALLSPKSNKARHIPMDTDLYEILFKRKKSTGYVFLDDDGSPFDHKRLARRLAVVCKKAGLRHITWHTLRHTFGSHLAMRGAPMPAIKELMGHANVSTTMRYVHLSPSTLRAAIELLNPRTLTQQPNFRQPVVNAKVEAARVAGALETETA